MLGFSPTGSEPIGGFGAYAAPPVVLATATWTEAPDAVAAAVVVSAPASVSASASWIEAADAHLAALAVSTPLTVVAGWVEAPEMVQAAITVQASEFVRAPAGSGFQPRRCGGQNCPPAFQGRCK